MVLVYVGIFFSLSVCQHMLQMTSPKPLDVIALNFTRKLVTRLCMAVGNMPDCRYVSDCRSRGQEFDPGPIPYFRGD